MGEFVVLRTTAVGRKQPLELISIGRSKRPLSMKADVRELNQIFP